MPVRTRSYFPISALEAKEVQSVPISYFDLERNLGMFGNLIGTVLGNTHIITARYQEFWTLLLQGYCQELQQIIDNKRYVKPAHILRSIQLVCYNWFTQHRAQLTPPQPDFTSIIYNIVLNTYVLPNLPPALYKLVYPPAQSAGTLPPLSSMQMLSITSSSGSSSNGSGGTQSVISGLMAPSVTPTPTRQCGAHVANLSQDTPGIKIKDLMGMDPPAFA